jgi:phage portal protein BeeE
MKWPLKWTGIKSETKASQGKVRPYFVDGQSDEFLYCSLAGETITPSKAFTIYRQNSSVASSVDMIADAFAQIVPVLKMKDGTVIDSHPVLDLLRQPNSYMDYSGFAARIARHYLLTKDCPMYALGVNTLPPQEVFPVRPTFLSYTTGGDEYVDTFRIGTGVAAGVYRQELTKDRISRYFDQTGLKELYRISGFSSLSTDAMPDSPLQAAALETSQQLKGKISNVQLLSNGGRPSMLIIFKDTNLDDAEMRRRMQALNEQAAGEHKTGKIMAVEGGEVQSVTEMGKTPKDMDWHMLHGTSDKAIYFRFRIPLPLVTTDSTTFDNMGTGVEMLYDFAVLPTTDTLLSGLSRFLLPRFKISLGDAQLTYNKDSLQPLKKRMLDELEQRTKINAETKNEIREGMPNREPVENGDVIYQPATLIPIGMDINDDGGGEET